MNKIVLITGATSGFGEAMAHKFASEGYACIITGRRKEKLETISQLLEQQYNIAVLSIVLDVQDKAAVMAAMQQLPLSWQAIDVLINNAGLALGREPFDEADVCDWDTMIDTNVKGLLYVSKAIVPLMIREKKGGIIINIGSIAGKEVYKDGNVYCATKHAVDAISKAMRIDLLQHAIKVTVIHPGAADTEFSKVRFKGNAPKAAAVYQGYEPLLAADIANTAFYCATLPPHVCINDLVITPTAQANSFYLHK